MASRLRSLEQVKIAKAAAEEFDEAAALKSAINNVKGLADGVDKLEQRCVEPLFQIQIFQAATY